MFRPMRIDEIGSGRVARAIMIGGKKVLRGTELTHDELARMPVANRNALIENRIIEVFPRSVQVIGRQVTGAAAPAGAVRLKYAKGFGKYDVVYGVVIAEAIPKEDAERMVAEGGPPVEAQADVAAEGAQARAPDGQQAPAAKSPPHKAPAKRKRPKASPPPRGETQPNGPIAENGPVEE